MKSQQDPRHQKRVIIFKKLFAFSFLDDPKSIDIDIKSIVDNLDKIDDHIQQVAPEWPIAKLNKVDLAILRQAVFELLIEAKAPPKVIIDEAVEIGKQFGSDNTAKFVNGVLGGLLNKLV